MRTCAAALCQVPRFNPPSLHLRLILFCRTAPPPRILITHAHFSAGSQPESSTHSPQMSQSVLCFAQSPHNFEYPTRAKHRQIVWRLTAVGFPASPPRLASLDPSSFKCTQFPLPCPKNQTVLGTIPHFFIQLGSVSHFRMLLGSICFVPIVGANKAPMGADIRCGINRY